MNENLEIMKVVKTTTRGIIMGIVLIISQVNWNYSLSQSDHVNLQDSTVTAKQKDSISLNYKFNASMMYAKGRLNQFMIPLSLQLTLSNEVFNIELIGKYTYHKINGFELENEILTRSVFTLFPQKRIRPVAGYIYESSLLYQLKSRHSPGLGFGLTILENKKHQLLLNSFGSYDKTEFENVQGYETFRANLILWGSHELIKDKISLNYSFFYFQSVQDQTNYVIRFEPKLLFKLSNILSLSANLNYRYENIVDPISTRENLFMTVGFQIANMR